MDREALLEPVIASIRKGTTLSRFQILKGLEDWEVVPFVFAGGQMGTGVVKGTEIHFALLPGCRPAASVRRAVREFLQPLFERNGFLTTRVRLGQGQEKEFVRRIGFKPTWHDDQFQYYLLGALPFARS